MQASPQPQRPKKGSGVKEIALGADKQMKRARAERDREMDKIANEGPRPAEASKFFLPHNKDFYNVPTKHLISCAAPVVKDASEITAGLLADGLKARIERRIAYINAGRKSKSSPWGGVGLQGKFEESKFAAKARELGLVPGEEYTLVPWQWKPLPNEAHKMHYLDPVEKVDKKTGEEVRNYTKMPGEQDYELGANAVYSSADVLARYMGYKALYTSATNAFGIFVLGMPHDFHTGSSLKWTRKPDPSAAGAAAAFDSQMKAYEADRARIRESLQKIYLVYPHPVDPIFGPDGCAYSRGSVSAALKDRAGGGIAALKPGAFDFTDKNGEYYEDAIGTEVEGEVAPQPCILCSLDPDRRVGAPNSGQAPGYHDSTRANPLSAGAIDLIKQLIRRYELEEEFPALLNLHPKRSSALLDLQHWRKTYASALGACPGQDHEPVDEDWKRSRASMPFGKVWVQHCDAKNPLGAVEFGTNTPKLVPLLKGRAEERNGVCWLDPEKIDQGHSVALAQHYCDIMTSLYAALGKAWDKKGTARRAALAGAYCAEGMAAKAAADAELQDNDFDEAPSAKKRRVAKAKQDAQFLGALTPSAGGGGDDVAARALSTVGHNQRDAEFETLRKQLKETKDQLASAEAQLLEATKLGKRNRLVVHKEYAKPGRVYFGPFDSKLSLVMPDTGRGNLTIRAWRHNCDKPEHIVLDKKDEVEFDFTYRRACAGDAAATDGSEMDE